MPTIAIPAGVDLRDVLNLRGPIQSVYFRQPSGGESTAERRHAVVTCLAEQGGGAEGLRAVDEVLCDVPPGRGAVALFVGDGGEHRLIVMPNAGVSDQAGSSALPNLLPLLAWQQGRAPREGDRDAEAGIRNALDELAAHSGPDGLAVQGAPAVLHALARGRVRTLLVTDFGDDERVVWFGERPSELAGHRGELGQAGAHARHGRLVDAAVRAAVLTGADIRVLRPGTAGAPAQGLGALCRSR
ncbi:hypothetical protein [Catenulispora subtropica]|uniref:SseB protein N-terminal domain-containing protein n=1 Tax=Catenulispora subtropica TaxID=450798 RepID=A0ABP5CQB6_9ACTN